jgi:hypothetical protein
MRVTHRLLRVALLAAGAALLAVAANELREKQRVVDQTTDQIEGTIAGLDPDTRAAVIARLSADAAREAKDRLDK